MFFLFYCFLDIDEINRHVLTILLGITRNFSNIMFINK